MSRDERAAASTTGPEEFRELHRNFPDLIERLRLRAMGAKANRQEITMALHAEAADAIEELCAALSEDRQLRWRLRSEVDRAWAVLDWLAENNPAALELCPYKAKR